MRNNFFDGSRQDAYDLFTGAWTPKKGVKGDKRALFVRVLPYIWFLSIFFFLALFFVPLVSGAYSTIIQVSPFLLYFEDRFAPYGSAFAALALTVASLSFYAITERGIQYVAWPTLNYPENILTYSGPGYSSGRHGRIGSGKYATNHAGPQTISREKVPQSTLRGRRGATYSDDE